MTNSNQDLSLLLMVISLTIIFSSLLLYLIHLVRVRSVAKIEKLKIQRLKQSIQKKEAKTQFSDFDVKGNDPRLKTQNLPMSIIDLNNSVTEKVLEKEISYNNPIYSLEIPEQPKFDSILLKAETLNKTTQQECLVSMSSVTPIPAQDHDPVEEYDHLVYNRGINEASEDYCTSMGSIV